MAANHAVKLQRLNEKAKRNLRTRFEDNVMKPLILIPRRGVNLKTKHEIDKATKKKDR